MDEVTLRGKLLIKEDVKIHNLSLKQLEIRDILRMGVDEFDGIRRFALYDVKSIDSKYKPQIDEYMSRVKEQLIAYYPYMKYTNDYTIFDLICYEQTFNHMFIEFLNTFTNHTIISVNHIPEFDNMNIIYDDTKLTMIKRSDFKEMINVFSILNYAIGIPEDNIFMERKKDSEVERYESEVAEMLAQFGFKEEKPKTTLYSIMEWLVNDGDGYTHENIGSKTIYQVMSSYNRKNHIDYCETINQIRCNGLLGKMDKKDLEKATPSFEIYR